MCNHFKAWDWEVIDERYNIHYINPSYLIQDNRCIEAGCDTSNCQLIKILENRKSQVNKIIRPDYWIESGKDFKARIYGQNKR